MNVSTSQARIAAAILGAVVAALLLDRLIVTDTKRVERTVRQMADAVAKGDVELLFSHVAEDYRDESQSRDGLKAIAAQYMGHPGSVRPKVGRMSVTLSGTLARVEMSVSGSVASGENRMPLGEMDWAAEFRKGADGNWRLTSLTPVGLWGRHISGWRDLPRDAY